jgi:hypothetical protein
MTGLRSIEAMLPSLTHRISDTTPLLIVAIVVCGAAGLTRFW